jgi:hypothetical protein
MRWFHIRRAMIDDMMRKTFEQYGVQFVQQSLAIGKEFRYLGKTMWVEDLRQPILAWLTEQFDRAERKDTWQTTMEAAITVLVGAELIFSIANFIRHKALTPLPRKLAGNAKSAARPFPRLWEKF